MFKFTTLLVVLLAFAAHAFATITLAGNVTLTASSQSDWQYRETSLQWSILTATAYFTSEAVSRAGGSLSGDLIIGGIRPGGGLLNRFPGSFLAYYEENVNVTSDADDIFSVDVSKSGGYVGSTYYGLIERNSAGVDVAFSKFNTLSWSATDTQLTGILKYATFTATVKTSCTVSITHAVSSHVGVLSLAGAIVTPKVVETIMEIDNWPYLSSENTLTLVMVAATGSGSAQKTILASGSGANQVYFQLNATAVVSGTTQGVTISATATANANLADSDLQAALAAKYQGSVSVQQYNVTFPAGAATIVYDPTTGSGTPVTQEESNTSSSSAAGVVKVTVGFLFACVVAALL